MPTKKTSEMKKLRLAVCVMLSLMMAAPMTAQRQGQQGAVQTEKKLSKKEQKALEAQKAKELAEAAAKAEEAAGIKSDEAVDKKAAGWVADLKLNDPAKEARVSAAVATHLKAVRDWHNAHAAMVPAGAFDPITGKEYSALHRQMIGDSAIPKSYKEDMMKVLNAELTEAQVEAILDKYTVGKVEFTMNGYRSIVPNMTAEDEAFLYKNLKEARYRAIDFKNMNQISAIFEIYKTINEQYFTNSGRDWRTMYKAYTDKVKAEKAAAAAKQQ